jgi:phosphoribosylanthranilate isomerase
MVKVKVCGITNAEDAVLACELGAAALGFIFVKASPRYIDPQAARTVIRELPPFVSKVGVFVNANRQTVLDIVKTAGLSLIQLHGDESPAYCDAIPLPRVKAFRIEPDFEPDRLTAYACSAYLLDTFSEQAHGGTGRTFDWQIAQRAKAMGRIILAGGLNPENIAAAVKTVAPYAVDVSSGIEAKPGKKDATKMKSLFEAVEQVHASLSDK